MTHLQKSTAGQGDSPFAPPPPPDPVVGGGEALRVLTDALGRGERVAITGASHQFGLGRRSLAAEFCALAREAFGGHIVWLPGRAPEPRLVVSRLALALEGAPPRSRIASVPQALERLLEERRPLIVLEDAEPAVVALFPPMLPLVAVVRDPSVAAQVSGARVAVEGFTEEDWHEVVTQRLGRRSGALGRAAARLGPLLDFHPLSACLALSLLEVSGGDDPQAQVARIGAKLRRLASFPSARRGVAAVFSVLLDSLSPTDRQRIAALGTLPPEGFAEETAARALGLDQPATRRALALCSRLGLVQPLGGGRLRMQSVLGDLARGIGDPEEAHRRVAEHHLETAWGADPQGGVFDVEAEGLIHSLRWAAEHQEARLTADLALAIAPWIDARGFSDGAAPWLEWGVSAAEALGEPAVRGRLLQHLAGCYRARGAAGSAAARQALTAASLDLEEDPTQQAVALVELSELHAHLGARAEAIDALKRVRALVGQELISFDGVAVGRLELRLGQLQAQSGLDAEAAESLQQALTLLVGGGAEPALLDEVRRALEAANTRLSLMDVFQAEAEEPAEGAGEPPMAGGALNIDAAVHGSAPRKGPADPAPGETLERSSPYDPELPLAPAPPPPSPLLDPEPGEQRYQAHLQRLERALQDGDVAEVARVEGALGRLLGARGDLDRARHHYGRAVEHHRSLGDRDSAADTLDEIGGLSVMAGELDDALCHLLASLELREEGERPEARASTLLGLSQVFFARGAVDDGMAHLSVSEALFERAQDLRGLAAVRMTRCAGLCAARSFAEAEAWARRGLALAEELQDASLIAEGEQRLGELMARRGAFEEAAARLRRSVHLRWEGADAQGATASLQGVGELHRQRGDHSAAWSYHRRIYEIAGSLGLNSVRAASGRVLGDLAAEAGHREAAETHYREVLAHHQRLGDRGPALMLHLKLGDLALDGRELAQAIAAYDEALRLAEAEPSSHGLAVARYKLGLARALGSDMVGARDALEAGLGADISGDDSRGMAATLTLLGQLDVSEGRVQRARDRWGRAMELLQPADPRAAATLRHWLERLPA